MTEDSRFDGKDWEFDGRLMEDGLRLTIFWHPALHYSHSRPIWDIWHKTNLFHFLWGSLHRARAEEKVLSILTWERYRWFDAISGRFDCVCYIPRISRVAIPMIPAHMWTRLILHWQWNKPIFMHHLWTFWDSSLCWILNRVLWSRAPFRDPSQPPCWYLN